MGIIDGIFVGKRAIQTLVCSVMTACVFGVGQLVAVLPAPGVASIYVKSSMDTFNCIRVSPGHVQAGWMAARMDCALRQAPLLYDSGAPETDNRHVI